MLAIEQHGHTWRPIELPADVEALARPELRALETLWTSSRAELERLGTFQMFWERMARWWAIETGVIEGIFNVSLGVTRSLIEQGLLASLIPHGESNRPAEEVIEILGDHREALDMVLDIVGGTRPLTLGWIKELHAMICRHQDTAKGIDVFGNYVQIPLVKGEFKVRPNSVKLPNGERHEYCPPEQVTTEMERLLELYARIPRGLPEVRTAWLHHAFTQIHPFQDGNGRVARALASIDFIRAGLFPLLVERQERDLAYIPALMAADQGDLAPLVKFFASRQERMVRKAISTAEIVTSHLTSRKIALANAREKIRRREQIEVEASTLSPERVSNYAALIVEEFDKSRAEILVEVPSVTIRVRRRDANTSHWWREQILREAKRGDYWADLQEPWEWVSLSLQDGGKTSFVVVLHFVGNPTPGAVVAIAFVTHREKTDEETTVLDAAQLNLEPLMLYPHEVDAHQKTRFLDWLSQATTEAIAVWTRYL